MKSKFWSFFKKKYWEDTKWLTISDIDKAVFSQKLDINKETILDKILKLLSKK